MSEQKYYVKLKSPNDHLGIWWCGDRSEWQSYSDPVYVEELVDFGEREVICVEVSKSIPSFTKSELAEIMDGAFAKDVSYDDSTEIEMVGEVIDGYWINPLIELIPVEEE